MKCLRIVGQGVPIRVSDEEAAELIRIGDGEYCSKSFWKNWHNGNEERFGISSRINSAMISDFEV